MIDEARKEEEEFDEWLDSVVIVDDEGVPIEPKLIEDEDEGEDGEFEK